MESEDDESWLTSTPTIDEAEEDEEQGKKKRKKVITLDEILEAGRQESAGKLKPRKNAKLLQRYRAKAHLYESTDSEEDAEAYRRPTELLEELEEQVATVADEVEPEWGLPVLAAAQCEPPSLPSGGVPEIFRALQVSKEHGRETSLEELVRERFLLLWDFCSRRCDEFSLRWAYHQMAYSTDDSLRMACCRFLYDVVSRISSDSKPALIVEWLPTLADFTRTFGVYGYKERQSDAENVETLGERTNRTPAKNLSSMFEFIAVCFARRNIMQPYYSVEDVSQLLRIMMHLALEHGLLRILDKIQDCILNLLRYFTAEEWPMQCSVLANVISTFTEKPFNGVHALNVVSGLGNRSVDLQRHLALLQLTKLARRKITLGNSRDVTSLFVNVQLKAKFVDFKKLYYQVIVADTFLWCNEEFGSDGIARDKWMKFLGACSQKIYVTDQRPFASKLRNIAAFFETRYSELDFFLASYHEFEGLGREDSAEKLDEED